MRKFIFCLICINLLASCGTTVTKPDTAKNNVASLEKINLPDDMELFAQLPDPNLDFFSLDFFRINYFSIDQNADIVYYLNKQNKLVSYNIKTNKTVWKATDRHPVQLVKNTYNGKVMLIKTFSKADKCFFIDPETGKDRFMLDFYPGELLYADEQKMLFQAIHDDGEMICIDIKGGKCLWTFKTPGFGQAPRGVTNHIEAFSGNKAIIVERHNFFEGRTCDANLFEFDLEKGSIIKHFEPEPINLEENSEENTSYITYISLEDKSKIIILEKKDGENTTYLLDVASDQILWSKENFYPQSLGQYDNCLIVTDNNKISKLNIDTGKIEWSHEYTGQVSILSCDRQTILFELKDNPEEISVEYAEKPFIRYNKEYMLKLDFSTGNEIEFYETYSETKSSSNLRNVVETLKNKNITVERTYSITLEGAKIKQQNGDILRIKDNNSSIFEIKMPNISKIWVGDKTVIVLTKKEIFGFRNGKQAWKTKRLTSSDYPKFYLTTNNKLYLIEQQGDNTFHQIEEETGKVNLVIRYDDSNFFGFSKHSKGYYCFKIINKSSVQIFKVNNYIENIYRGYVSKPRY